MRRRSTRLISLWGAVLLLGGCDGTDSARALWKNVLRKCSQNDLLGKQVLYFGPSNGIGPGAVWRKTSSGGYNLRWQVSDLGFSPAVVDGKPSTCSGSSTSTSKISPSVSASTVVPSLSGTASADFQRAQTITVEVGTWRWDQIAEGPYEQALKAPGLPASVKSDLQGGNRFVLVRGLRVSGLTADLKFDSSTASELKAKYGAGSVDVGVGLKAQFTSDTNLKITSTSDFYLAGELYELNAGGFAATAPMIGPQVKDLEKVAVGRDDK